MDTSMGKENLQNCEYFLCIYIKSIHKCSKLDFIWLGVNVIQKTKGLYGKSVNVRQTV